MPEEVVKQLYVTLLKLFKTYQSGKIDKTLLKVTQDFCKNLYNAAKAEPDLIFAQPQLYKLQLPFGVNLAFNATVYTCLIAVRNKFDPAVTIQLMCNSLSIYALEQSSLENYYQTVNHSEERQTFIGSQKNLEFSKLLKIYQQHIWSSNYHLCSYIHANNYPQTQLNNPTNAVTYIANKLAILCTPNKIKQPFNFANAFKRISIECCPRWYDLMIPLIEYPSLIPPGSYIRLQNDSIHLVLGLVNKGLVTQILPTNKSKELATSLPKIQITLSKQIQQSYSNQKLKTFTRLNQWWNDDFISWQTQHSHHEKVTAFETILPMQVAPASLLVIQDQLNHMDADVAVIVKAIEKEPAYAHQLQISASIINRQKQAVSSIQHSLAMLGFERTNSTLLQHSLLSRLNQNYFPLQQKLLNFSQLFAFIASELASRTKLTSPETASTSAYFIVSRLFTLPSIRSLSHWELAQEAGFKIASVIKVSGTDSLNQDGLLLAKAWQQNEQILAVLKNRESILAPPKIDEPIQTLCFLMGVSLILAQQNYFAETPNCDETDTYFDKALIALKISRLELSKLINEILASTKVYSELE